MIPRQKYYKNITVLQNKSSFKHKLLRKPVGVYQHFPFHKENRFLIHNIIIKKFLFSFLGIQEFPTLPRYTGDSSIFNLAPVFFWVREYTFRVYTHIMYWLIYYIDGITCNYPLSNPILSTCSENPPRYYFRSNSLWCNIRELTILNVVVNLDLNYKEEIFSVNLQFVIYNHNRMYHLSLKINKKGEIS